MLRLAPLLAVVLLAGCPAPGARSTCRACVSDVDCPAERCVQLESDAVCAHPCATDADCASDDHCVTLVTAEGSKLSACLARDGACGAVSSTSRPDAGSPAVDCNRYQAPAATGTCCHCSSSTGSCAANKCYGGWACDAKACSCVPMPAACAGPVDALHAGGAVSANVSASGGTMNRLHFAVVGDARPALINDTSHYPLSTVAAIYTALANASPRPAFAVTTGDYVYATTASNQAAAQIDLYLQGRAHFPGPIFPAMGNHECNGYTSSNCGPGIGSGQTSNYKAFMAQLMGPLGESHPYYSRRVDASDHSWTAKFVVIAANSWSSAQATWLETALSVPTTYTFLVRHEPTGGTSTGSEPAPGVAPSETIAQGHPLTLELEGHAHTWMHLGGTKEVVVGNGGAPLTTSVPYGYTIVSQRADGALVVSGYALSDGHPMSTFAVKPDGTLTN